MYLVANGAKASHELSPHGVTLEPGAQAEFSDEDFALVAPFVEGRVAAGLLVVSHVSPGGEPERVAPPKPKASKKPRG